MQSEYNFRLLWKRGKEFGTIESTAKTIPDVLKHIELKMKERIESDSIAMEK